MAREKLEACSFGELVSEKRKQGKNIKKIKQ